MMGNRNTPRRTEPDPASFQTFKVLVTTGYDRRVTGAVGVGEFYNGPRYHIAGSAIRHPLDRKHDSEVGVKLAIGRALLDLGTLMIREAEARVEELNNG